MRKPTLVEGLALFSLAGWSYVTVLLRRAVKQTRTLESSTPLDASKCPSLSIIAPACNEANTVEPAARSLLSLDYPNLELVAVNDRSTDDTGNILNRLAQDDSRLRVIHIETLPAGWIGKNHALWKGASESTGEYILFTDADVLFRPDALRRAMAAVSETGADMLAMAPRVILCDFWERLLVGYFGLGFSLHFRPWEVSDSKSSAYVGIGAFNLVRRDAYLRMGGHSAMPMEVADDVKLGKLMKGAGARLVYRISVDGVRVRWVEGLKGFVHGLTKNMFAGLEYRWSATIGFSVLIGATHVFPAVGLFWGTKTSRLLFAGVLLAMATCAENPAGAPFVRAHQTGSSALEQNAPSDWWSDWKTDPPAFVYGLSYPLAAAIWIYTLWRSAVHTQINGGIVWRGTFYSLDELRAGVV